MDPGSAPLTRLVRDDGAFFLDVQAYENSSIIIGQPSSLFRRVFFARTGIRLARKRSGPQLSARQG
jgi:hypothetical protein